MKYKDTGFRAFYQHFIAVPLKDNLKAALKDFPDADKANCILTYGYIDRECGLTLEILAAGIEGKKGFNFADGNDTISSKIRIENVPNDDVAFFADEDGSLAKRYSQKIEMLHHYDAPEEVEKTRGMTFLDGSRDPNCVDDVLVYLVKDGLKPEGCWTRIIGLGDHWIMGTLLNEPDQDFGYHIGENIAFFVQETEDKKVILNAIEAHHNAIKATSLVAEVVKNAECFKFVTVKGALIWLHELGLRGVSYEESVERVIEKMEQKK